MKISLFAPVFVVAAACLAHAATPPPAAAAAASGVEVCAGAADAENLCSWDKAPGTHGRKCTLDVERIDRKYSCNYGQSLAAEMSDHKPMCFSAKTAEHILFQSSRKRQFRVRRLVPITKTNAQGQACPRDPFAKTFHEEDFGFSGSWDSLSPKASAIGCRYKLEVQWNALDAGAPLAPFDPQRRHLECRDPHLTVTGN